METCFRNIQKSFKNREKEEVKRQAEVRTIHLRGERILCGIKLETLGKEIAFYCLTVMASNK